MSFASLTFPPVNTGTIKIGVSAAFEAESLDSVRARRCCAGRVMWFEVSDCASTGKRKNVVFTFQLLDVLDNGAVQDKIQAAAHLLMRE